MTVVIEALDPGRFDGYRFAGKNSLQAAFEAALKVQDDPVALEAAWTRCLAIAPDNAAVWSNRGTARLALKMWKEAAEDLQKARELEAQAYGYASGFVLVALGNAKGALGRWEEAIECYEAALEDPYPGISALALASSSLAKFELKKDGDAVATAQQALVEAPEFGVCPPVPSPPLPHLTTTREVE
jgi:tetratricopeptide (TPR) repeat protein